MPIEGASDLTPVVPVTINGREVPVVLDTGSSLTLGIYLDAVDELGLATARDAATPRTLTGARGTVRSVCGNGRFACLGTVRLERVPTVFLPRQTSDPTRALGNLGNGFLQHTILTLDYPHRRLNIRAVWHEGSCRNGGSVQRLAQAKPPGEFPNPESVSWPLNKRGGRRVI